jgi:hypothetical protein
MKKRNTKKKDGLNDSDDDQLGLGHAGNGNEDDQQSNTIMQ